MKSGSKSLGPGGASGVLGAVWTALFVAAYFMAGQAVFFSLLGVGVVITLAWAWYVSRSDTRAMQIVEKYESSGDIKALSALYDLGDEALVRLGQKLENAEQEREFILKALGGLRNPVVVCDTDGRILHYSAPFAELAAKKSSKIVGFKLCEVLMERSGGCPLEEVAHKGGVKQEELDLNLWDGRALPIKFFATEIKDASGKRLGAMASMIDTSDRAHQLEAIEQQKNEMLSIGQQISELAQHVASASEELSASADEQERGAKKQKEQTDTVATAMEEMTATVLEVAQNASATSDAADEARVSAESGVEQVTRAVNGINDVARSASELAQVLEQLDSQSGEIGRIIGVINDIADQTNLLALNAAIEAARAGEAGRGFAVVADEVRKLAEKTMTATKEVEDAIKTIQLRSQDAMRSMKETESQVTESTELSNQAGESLHQIMGRIEDMVSRVAQIATAAEQQSSAAEEINQSIDDIAMVSSESEEGAVQAASATRDLAELSQKLLNMSMQFGGQEGGGKFRESKGQMKGVLPKLCQEFIRTRYPEAYKLVDYELGNPVFLPTASYPDQVLTQMAEIVCEKEDMAMRDFFLKLGDFTIDKFYEMYGRHFKQKDSLKDFYLRMNDIHAAVTKDQPGVKPPNFTFEDKGDTLFMNYRSGRGLFDYFEGILRGAARFKGEDVDIKVKPLDKEVARAEIRFK